MSARLLLLLLVSSASLFALGASSDEPEPVVHQVAIRQMKFVPEVLEVKAGDRIVWVNEDIFPHTVTATDGSPDSGLMKQNQTWTWIPDEKGEHAYVCAYHPTMKGKVVVK